MDLIFSYGAAGQRGGMAVSFFSFISIQNDAPQSVGLLCTSSARRRDLYLTQYNTQKRQTSMPPAGFEPAISARGWLQTHALDPADCLIMANTERIFISSSSCSWRVRRVSCSLILKMTHLPRHTNKCTEVIYYLNSVLIIHVKTLYSFVTPTCFDTLCVIIREHTLFLAKITDW
jgi:hypothetical protein